MVLFQTNTVIYWKCCSNGTCCRVSHGDLDISDASSLACKFVKPCRSLINALMRCWNGPTGWSGLLPMSRTNSSARSLRAPVMQTNASTCTALSDQVNQSLYILHGVYYLKDRECGPLGMVPRFTANPPSTDDSSGVSSGVSESCSRHHRTHTQLYQITATIPHTCRMVFTT